MPGQVSRDAIRCASGIVGLIAGVAKNALEESDHYIAMAGLHEFTCGLAMGPQGSLEEPLPDGRPVRIDADGQRNDFEP